MEFLEEGVEVPVAGDETGDVGGLDADEFEDVMLAVSLESLPLSNAAAMVPRIPGGAADEVLFLAGSRGISFPG
jgi:hypothetical protein